MIKIIDKLLNKVPMVKKIMIIFIGCTLLPNVLQSVFYVQEIEQNVKEELVVQMDEILDQKASEIEETLVGMINLSIRYSTNELFYKILSRDYTDYTYLVEYQDNVLERINNDLLSSEAIKEIVFYTSNETVLNSRLIRKMSSTPTIAPVATMQIPFKNKNTYLEGNIIYNQYQRIYDAEYSVVHELDYFKEYSDTDMKVKIVLDNTYIEEIVQDQGLFDGIQLCTEEGQVIFPETRSNAYQYARSRRSLASESMQVIERQIGGQPLYLYGYYNFDELLAVSRQRQAEMLLVIAGGTCVAVLCIWLIGRNLTRRTAMIVEQAEQITRGKFDYIGDNVNFGDDEIGMIEKSISSMGVRLQQLIEEEYKAEVLQAKLQQDIAEAKLHALQSQVNPHFLFNALESIRMKALSRGEVETARMIKYMAKMFRNILSWEDDLVPLREDIGFVREFLEIQKYRFGDEFSYQFKVDERVGEVFIPKMIVQPLVENACVHGIEAVSNEKRISVVVELVENQVMISIADNGYIPADKILQIRKVLKGELGITGSVGLTNVNERLKFYYQANYKIHIASSLEGGTTCEVWIPIASREGA